MTNIVDPNFIEPENGFSFSRAIATALHDIDFVRAVGTLAATDNVNRSLLDRFAPHLVEVLSETPVNALIAVDVHEYIDVQSYGGEAGHCSNLLTAMYPDVFGADLTANAAEAQYQPVVWSHARQLDFSLRNIREALYWVEQTQAGSITQSARGDVALAAHRIREMTDKLSGCENWQRAGELIKTVLPSVAATLTSVLDAHPASGLGISSPEQDHLADLRDYILAINAYAEQSAPFLASACAPTAAVSNDDVTKTHNKVTPTLSAD